MVSQNKMARWGRWDPAQRARDRESGPAPRDDVAGAILPNGFEPCLVTLLRVLAPRNAETDAQAVQPWLLAALARTGRLPRAAELAFSISDELRRGDALVALVKAAADAGDLHGARALAESIPLRQCRDRALVALVSAWARSGELGRAVALAKSIRYPHNWDITWALLARAAADLGRTREALAFADRAEELLRDAHGGSHTSRVLVLLLEVATVTGARGRAAELTDRLENFARCHGPGGQGFDLDTPRPLTVVLVPEILAGDLDRLDALLRRPHLSPLDSSAVAELLEAVAPTADPDVVLALAERMEKLLGAYGVSSPDAVIVGTAAALLLARHGQVERATAFADAMHAPDLRAGRQAQIVEELARGGDTARAGELAHAIADRWARTRALIAVARELARHGEPARAEALAHTIADRWGRGEALGAVAGSRPGRGSRRGPRRSPARSPTARPAPAPWPGSRSCRSRPPPAGSRHGPWRSASGTGSCSSWNGSRPGRRPWSPTR